jgi:rhodanese-related sulfurtransferase
MSEPTRISAQETRQKVSSGEALLVCVYDDAEKFQNNHLEGARSFSEFQSNLSTLAKDREIVFYCA